MRTIGSLCTGMGGLDAAVESVFDAEVVWVSEFDKRAAKVCEARFPGIPNLGDLTEIDWEVTPTDSRAVDILTAGYP